MAHEELVPPMASALSKSETAHRWMRQKIVAQEFTPGYRLILSTIAKELDMSVVPIREAVRRLEAEGLVTFERNIGAYVKMIDISGYQDSMETLAFLEGAATALSAPKLSQEDLEKARQVNELMLESLQHFDPRSFTVLNQEFHSHLYFRCDNKRLLELVNTEWVRLGNMRDSTFSFVPERARESVREHQHILSLIEDNAPFGEVELAVRRHRTATLDAYVNREHENEAVAAPPGTDGGHNVQQ